jgi:hypothetical protein
MFIPNIEIKYAREQVALEALEKRESLKMGHHQLFISPIEIQIPYKLKLGSSKDIEDAIYLWELLKDKLDVKKLRMYMIKMGVKGDLHGIG